MAQEVFDDPHPIPAKKLFHRESHHALKPYISSRPERRLTMKQASTKTTSAKRLKITRQTKEAYGNRDRRLDRYPDAPQSPPEYWNNAVIGKYYRPLKTQISFRIDNEVPDWLKSKGEGHLSRINQILRECMTRERQ
jgi:uncharacterized protein (DUF4415 family)